MGPGLLGYTIRRLLWAIPVLFAVSVILFSILRLGPNDPVDAILPRAVYTQQQADLLRKKYGYDQPVYQQYFTYMKNLLQGDPGTSIKHPDFTMREFVFDKMWVSSQINFMALIITFALGIPIGIYAALARGTAIDPLTIGFWLLIAAVPTFVAAPFLQWVFALKWDVISLTYHGVYSKDMILPILIIALPGIAGVARFMRASVIAVMGEDYVRTARAKGLKESTVVFSHITRNALLPMVTVIGLELPGITAGSLFVERAFGIPGLGAQALEAATTPDYDVILVIVLFGATLFVLANVVVDLLYAAIDPRVRVGSARG
jgi:ABC-type dipeptide/oligopeptide/nickel transport system permease component